MKFIPLPDQEVLRQILDYNPKTGELFWKERDRKFFKTNGEFIRWNNRYRGKPALNSVMKGGYLNGAIFKVIYQTHRVIWKMVTGSDPKEILDHINGNRTDNRWCNLREATFAQNVGNRFGNKETSSKYRGASWCERDKFWASYCAGVALGRFKTEEEAALAYNEYAKAHYKEFAKLNNL